MAVGSRVTPDSESEMSSLVNNGAVDCRGKVADRTKTGGWKASPFIIVNEVAERLAFFAIAVNLVLYFVREYHYTIADASTNVTNWTGASFALTLVGAFLADAYLGRFKTMLLFSCVYAMGMVLLTISAGVDSLRPPPCTSLPCDYHGNNGQKAFLFWALALIALGTGGIKPCVSSFGADQFDETDDKEVIKKDAFFNWFFFGINMGALIGLTALVYLQQEKGWTWGFAVPTAVMVVSVIILVAGFRVYRYQKPMGSPFTRFAQVMVVAVKNHSKGTRVGSEMELYEVRTKESDIHGARKLSHTPQYSFLDKAAIITDPEDANTKNRWKLCTVTQVEEFKSLIRVFPVWASTIALSISFAQVATYFIYQANFMDRMLGSSFEIPPGSVAVFAALNGLVLVPIYEKFIIPVLRKYTGHQRGITSLQRMGIGLFVSIFGMVSAALVEKKRRTSLDSSTMSVFYLVPQFFILGSAEVFTYVGQLEFFYNEATDGTRSISSALFLIEIGVGAWFSTAIVKIIERATGGNEEGWLRDNLNESKLDYFYWILAGISGVNFLVYLVVAMKYKGRDESDIKLNVVGIDENGQKY